MTRWSSIGPLVLVLAVLTGGVALDAALPAAVAPASVARSVPVVGAAAVCPDLRQGRTLTTRISAGVALVDKPPPGEAGSLTAQPLRAGASDAAPRRLPVTRSGQVAVGLGTEVDGDALVVRAEGPVASGLELEQVTRGEVGSERGLAGLRCAPPSTLAWFIGGATTVGDTSLLVLANTDDVPAVVDVTAWTADGPVDPRPGLGLSVAPHARAAIRLDEIAPDKALLALRVVAQRGRVAAAVRHVRYDGLTPRGVDWVPRALPPSTTVVVPGFPQGPGRRVVLVTNPGPDPTVVSLRLTESDRQGVPPGLDAIEVPAGTTVATDITTLTNRSPAAVTVTSDGGPVLAGGFVYDAQGRSLVKDFAYAGSGEPLVGPALLTDVVINRPTESTLLLSAPEGAATVSVRPVPVLGQGGPLPRARTVVVAAGRTVAVRLSTFLPPGATGQLAVEVLPQPGSGPVYAARYLRERGDRGPLTTLLTLQGAAQRVTVPEVRADPMVGVTR